MCMCACMLVCIYICMYVCVYKKCVLKSVCVFNIHILYARNSMHILFMHPVGEELHGCVFPPANVTSGCKYPTVHFIYGGPHFQVREVEILSDLPSPPLFPSPLSPYLPLLIRWSQGLCAGSRPGYRRGQRRGLLWWWQTTEAPTTEGCTLNLLLRCVGVCGVGMVSGYTLPHTHTCTHT